MTDEKSKEDYQELARIEKRLSEVDPNVFQGIPKPKRQQIIRSFAVTMSKTHIGPLPDPETLAEYSEIIPNGAERIMQMAEKQLNHRMNIENKVISGQLTQSNIGQFLAFFIGLTALGCSTYAIVNGFEWSGSALGLAGLTGLVTAFIKGRDYQNKNLENNRTKN